MDDLTLKGVIDPSSICIVICMSIDGSTTFGKLVLQDRKTKDKFRAGRIWVEVLGSNEVTDLRI